MNGDSGRRLAVAARSSPRRTSIDSVVEPPVVVPGSPGSVLASPSGSRARRRSPTRGAAAVRFLLSPLLVATPAVQPRGGTVYAMNDHVPLPV